MAAVTRRQSIKLLDGIVDPVTPVTANRVYSLIKQGDIAEVYALPLSARR